MRESPRDRDEIDDGSVGRQEKPVMRTGTSTIRSWRWACATSALVLGVSATVLGCGTPQKRYEVLSFFFDGVPNPDALAAAADAKADRSRRSGATVALVRHKPFADENCKACHKNDTLGPGAGTTGEARPAFYTEIAAKGPKSDVCMDCHQEVPTRHEVMHGPVAVGACNFCHSPHASKHPALLKTAAPKLCMQCHGPTGLSQGAAGHADANANCLECHSGHGGARNLLKTQSVTLSMPPGSVEGADNLPRAALETSPLVGLKARVNP